mgnify:CR=1 FL=1
MVIIVEKESFMSTIPIQKTLSKEELYTLIQNYQKNHDQKSKEMIILSNTKLVLSLMKRFYQKSNHYEDLFQVGIVGLIKAIDHFDTNYQLQFSTYAVPLIIGEMKRYLRDNTQVKISRPIKDLAYAILKEKEKYLNQYQREPTIQELSQNLNIEKQNIIRSNAIYSKHCFFPRCCRNDNQNELSIYQILSHLIQKH